MYLWRCAKDELQTARKLTDYFQGIMDYRSSRNKKHELVEMVICLVFGFLAGKTTISRALKWCSEHLDFLRKFIPLKNGIASKATISRMLAGIKEEDLEYAFILWAADLIDIRGRTIILDGQGLIAGTNRIENGKTPYVINAIDMESQLVVAQYAIPNKTNEQKSFPEILSRLNIANTTVLIDAAGTNTEVMNTIIQNGGHFLLTVKRNNPKMYDELMEYFVYAEKADAKQKQKKPLTSEEAEMLSKLKIGKWKAEKNRERNEYRKCDVSEQTSYISRAKEDLPFLKQIGFLQTVRIMRSRVNGVENALSLNEMLAGTSGSDDMKSPVQKIGLITDLVLSPEEMMVLKRNEWRIENGLHHVLHESFREDRCPARKGKNNLAILRKTAYNLLRLAIIRGDVQNAKSFSEAMDDFGAPSSMGKLYAKYLFHGVERIN